MKTNVGSFDRIVRLALGLALLVVGVAGYVGVLSLAWLGIGQALASVVVAVVGAILLVTGTTRFCAIYALLGLSTADRPADAASRPRKSA
ncbi:MAG: DUF2892 domain-containing protein [Halobacteriales archaeon]